MSVLLNPWLFGLLALALPVYWLALRKPEHRTWAITGASLAGLALLHPVFTAYFIVGVVALYHLVLRAQPGKSRLLWAVGVAVATLFVGKYAPELGAGLGLDGVAWGIVVPLGVSYLSFRVIHLVLAYNRGTLGEMNFRDVLAYVSFLPTFPGGPLESYQGFRDKRHIERFDPELFAIGLRRIPLGLFKKLVVVEIVIAAISGRITDMGFLELDGVDGSVRAWWFVILMYVRAYFDLSALTDLAVGTSALLGYRVMENFDKPFIQPDIGAFWRSWHISLSTWCRTNVYFPVFGATRNVPLGLYATMLVMGLWHELNWSWALWGVYHGSALIAHAKWTRWRRKRKKIKKLVKHPIYVTAARVGTFFFVALGYGFVANRDVTDALRTVGTALELPLRAVLSLF